jgi:hypothetical protein
MITAEGYVESVASAKAVLPYPYLPLGFLSNLLASSRQHVLGQSGPVLGATFAANGLACSK